MLACCQSHVNFTDGDTFAGSGAYAGKTFLVVKLVRGGSSVNGFVVLETSDTWETN